MSTNRFKTLLVASPFLSLGLCSTLAWAQGSPDCCNIAITCAGDANQDGVVDPLDTGFILSRFGDDVLVSNNCQADVNCDGIIDPMDVGYSMERFNQCDVPNFCAPGGGDCGEAQPHDCCPGDEVPGCQTQAVRDCVCAFDPVCCITWDEACEEEVEIFGCGDCDAGCDTLPVNDDCACAPPVVIEDNEIVQFFGDSTGATLECEALGIEEVWHSWTHLQTDTIRVDYCGTDVDFSFLYIVADNSCPCDGTFIFGTQFTAVCADATTAAGLRFTNLAAGTYYYPVLAGASGVDGPYGIRIRRNNVN